MFQISIDLYIIIITLHIYTHRGAVVLWLFLLEMDQVTGVQIFDKAICISHRIGNDMNPTIPLLAMPAQSAGLV